MLSKVLKMLSILRRQGTPMRAHLQLPAIWRPCTSPIPESHLASLVACGRTSFGAPSMVLRVPLGSSAGSLASSWAGRRAGSSAQGTRIVQSLYCTPNRRSRNRDVGRFDPSGFLFLRSKWGNSHQTKGSPDIFWPVILVCGFVLLCVDWPRIVAHPLGLGSSPLHLTVAR